MLKTWRGCKRGRHHGKNPCTYRLFDWFDKWKVVEQVFMTSVYYITYQCCQILHPLMAGLPSSGLGNVYIFELMLYMSLVSGSVHGSFQRNILFLQYLSSWTELIRALSKSCNSSGCYFHLVSCVAGWVQQNCAHFGQHLLSQLKGKGALSLQSTSPES